MTAQPCPHHAVVLTNLRRLGTLTKADRRRIQRELANQCCSWPRANRT